MLSDPVIAMTSLVLISKEAPKGMRINHGQSGLWLAPDPESTGWGKSWGKNIQKIFPIPVINAWQLKKKQKNAKKHWNNLNHVFWMHCCSLPEREKNQRPKWPDMDTAKRFPASHIEPRKKPITESQWAHASEIYQKWYSAVNEEGGRLLHYPSITHDVLQISYQAATSSCWEADLIDESKKVPHGHHSVHTAPFPSIQPLFLCARGLGSTVWFLWAGMYTHGVH